MFAFAFVRLVSFPALLAVTSLIACLAIGKTKWFLRAPLLFLLRELRAIEGSVEIYGLRPLSFTVSFPLVVPRGVLSPSFEVSLKVMIVDLNSYLNHV